MGHKLMRFRRGGNPTPIFHKSVPPHKKIMGMHLIFGQIQLDPILTINKCF